ncbi:MAG: zinc ribbon domain-containing protein [Phycisphaeraceae bacterium]|nr:zinc ribbon domain-containing protein [Phycisphaeraceae bacterium]
MRIAHTCANCGHDLSRLCALIDPVYGLPIVVCPRCREAVVRTSIPVRTRARQARRLVVSLAMLAFSVLLTTGFAGAVIGLSSVVFEQWVRAQRNSAAPWTHEGFVVAAAVWAGLALTAGVWTGAMLAHWRWWLVLPAWVAMLFGLIFFVEVQQVVEFIAQGEEIDVLALATGVVQGHSGTSRVLIASLVPFGLGYAVGLPIGAFTRRSAARRMWRRRRRIRLHRRNA